MSPEHMLQLLKKEVRAYQSRMLDEAEHAIDINAGELQFAATTAAATAEIFVAMIKKYEGLLSNLTEIKKLPF